MIKYTILFVLIFIVGEQLSSQPTLNNRYNIDETSVSIFGRIISTDSCYYLTGIHLSSPEYDSTKGSFIKMSLSGEVLELTSIVFDTMGIDLWQNANLIQTLDSNFACVALAFGSKNPPTFMFIKLNTSGDTLITNHHFQYYQDEGIIAITPSDLIQNDDSTYFGIANGQRDDDLRGLIIFYKLDKNGELLFHKTFYGISVSYYSILVGHSLIQYAPNKLIIAASVQHSDAIKPDIRVHTKLLILDTLGNLLEEHTYWEDTLALGCKGLTKTVDGGLIYGGLIGRYFPEAFSIRYIAQIVKLNADYTLDWKILLGKYIGLGWIGIEKIIAIGNREYVAVGMTTSTTDRVGWLIKFNDSGELIWERKYFKVPHFTGETNYPRHELYDVALTPDSGFVMVGQAINYYADNGFLPGQKAWLVKTDKYGCLVPGCQLADTTSKPKPIDSTVVETPPILTIYPNPTSTSIFYYHHQDNFQFGTAYIYNMQGDIVQKWEISTNDITYEIDVSTLAAGQYILKVFNELGEPLETAKFVKV